MVVQFSAHESVMAKLERVRHLASHRLPANASIEQVLELLADYFIEGEDPGLRRERRLKREAAAKTPVAPRNWDARHVPARVRDEVFVRDEGKCTFKRADGRRCGSDHLLQVDHIVPVARGGSGTPDNLRLLCAQHNRLEAERLMGEGICRPPS
jgi:hypothetical protein